MPLTPEQEKELIRLQSGPEKKAIRKKLEQAVEIYNITKAKKHKKDLIIFICCFPLGYLMNNYRENHFKYDAFSFFLGIILTATVFISPLIIMWWYDNKKLKPLKRKIKILQNELKNLND